MISIDKHAYMSKLKNVDPMQKSIFALLTLGVCLWADSRLIALAVIFMMGGVTVLRGGVPLRYFAKLLLIPMSFLTLGVLSIVINISADHNAFLAAIPLADSWAGFTGQGVRQASLLFLKALGSVSCLYFLSLTTPMTDLLMVLRRLRLPKLFVEMMELIYRFIFVLLETADTIYNAQDCRLGYSGLKSAFRSLGALGTMLFIRSYKQSDEIYTALESRGYEGEFKMQEETYESHWSGYVMAVAVNILLVVSAFAVKKASGGSVYV